MLGLAGCAARQPAPLTYSLDDLGDVLRATESLSTPASHECALHPGIGAASNTNDALETMRGCYDIPVVANSAVRGWIRYYQGRGRSTMDLYLRRSGRYLPMMREELREAGLPQDLVYVAIAESGLSTHAVSTASAVGPWQFIPSTGRRYNLREDDWIDLRRDPVLATRAAARHLSWLHGRFDDWHLAAAGYNAGAGKVRRAVQIYKTRDFWRMREGSYLREETRQYVPKILAIAFIAKHPEHFGFAPAYDSRLSFDTVRVADATSLVDVARLAGAPLRKVKALNPALKRFCTPPGRAWDVRIPAGTHTSVMLGLASGDLPTWRLHTVRRGETIAGIAKRYGTRAAAIMSANAVRNPRTLDVGTVLMVPVPASTLVASGSTSAAPPAAPVAE